ncbi:MAG TPA: phosphogluconate dehydratase [Caulobacteraceae bacterium]|nr:phosphogluconate dehydratase [Caulobacteraceae bacterium]
MPARLNDKIAEVTDRIVERSREARGDYLGRIEAAAKSGPGRAKLSCANWAHAFAGSPAEDKLRVLDPAAPNIGIVTAYNDMLSAHQPFEDYPKLIRQAAREVGATAQVAGGVPAMCDGVTQGRPGMELSLFSRDVIAMSVAVALSHDAFDGALCLGVCDKIVPGLMIGSLAFGHLPVVFAPAGPMPSGISNAEKAKVRGLYAEGKVGRDELLKAEMGAYHGPGTCTFYGTANSNQMLMEMMGVHLPGAAFVNPGTPLREALTRAAAQRLVQIRASANDYTPLGRVIDEKAVVNGVIGLVATGGSTNHALHLVVMARAAGVLIDWDDMNDISNATPLLARVYPNGPGDVNQFQAAGGLSLVTRELLANGMMHEDVLTVAGQGMGRYTSEPFLQDGALVWKEGPSASLDLSMVRPASDPFDTEGGLKLLKGGLGRAVIKTSAVKPEHRVVEAPAEVFEDQDEFLAAFKAGRLDKDFVAVVRFQGPKANGMPELHSLSPALGVLQDRGRKVALVTDGRMSGASGKTPAAIHLTPEAADGGPISRVQTGDIIRLDADRGLLEIKVDPAVLAARPPGQALVGGGYGMGRELFAHMRAAVGPAEHGATALFG